MAMFFSRITASCGLTVLIVGSVVHLASCSGGKQEPTDANPVSVTVQVIPGQVVAGETVTLVWRFALAKDWHLYWSGRNDSGYPPRIDLSLPEGWLAGGLQWPVPERYVSPGDILDHVYFGELILVQKIGAPAEVQPGTEALIEADVQWLACKDMCVPGRQTLTFSIPVSSTAVAAEEPNLVQEALSRLPVALPAGILDTGWNGSTFHLDHPDARLLTFMPTEDCGQLVDLLSDGQGHRLALRFKPKGDTVGPVRGLIIIEENSGQVNAYRLDYPATVLTDASVGG
jgi:DsbC/DsbD-like thiol-disulfide interchange protein